MATKRLRHRSLPFALDEALSDREAALYKAAHAAAYGERQPHPQPRDPTVVEEQYLYAIEAFFNRRPTLGYDYIERGNHRALLRLGRSRTSQRNARDPSIGTRTSQRKDQAWISDKIRVLRHEGYPERQAIAIAYRMAGIPPRKQKRRS